MTTRHGGADGVTICIPTIPPRAHLLARAVDSIGRQEHPVSAISIARDVGHDGAWTTRNWALESSRTEWTGFLDDDDELLPHHVSHLLDTAREHDAVFARSGARIY